jgi:hypothetical protein
VRATVGRGEGQTHSYYDSLVTLGCRNYEMADETEDIAADQEPTAAEQVCVGTTGGESQDRAEEGGGGEVGQRTRS